MQEKATIAVNHESQLHDTPSPRTSAQTLPFPALFRHPADLRARILFPPRQSALHNVCLLYTSLPMPLGIQHPDGHQGVMHLAPAQVNAAVSENAEVITLLRSKLLSVNGAVEAQDLLQLAVQRRGPLPRGKRA